MSQELTGTISQITEDEIHISILGQTFTCPKNLFPSAIHKKTGEQVVIKIQAPNQQNPDSEAYYQALKKALRDLIK